MIWLKVGRPFVMPSSSFNKHHAVQKSIMKFTQALFLAAQLAAVAVSEFYPVNILDERTRDPEHGNAEEIEGAEALSYLFDYDPSRSHGEERPINIYKWLDGTSQNCEKMGEYRTNYDTGYLERICSPRMATGEYNSAYMNL